MTKREWGYGLAFVVFGYLMFRVPPLRQVVLFLLPLGSGIDDLAELVFLVAVVGFIAYRIIKHLEQRARRRYEQPERYAGGPQDQEDW